MLVYSRRVPRPKTADHLDWKRPGLTPWGRRVVRAVCEALFADEDDEGRLVPGSAAACDRAVAWLDDALGRGSTDLRRGFFVLTIAMELAPLFVIGALSRASRLSLADRVRYLSGLENSSIGWLSLLLVAFKVPLSIPAFEEGDELSSTGFDRPSTTSRRVLPIEARS